jgi:hypothetical protein
MHTELGDLKVKIVPERKSYAIPGLVPLMVAVSESHQLHSRLLQAVQSLFHRPQLMDT